MKQAGSHIICGFGVITTRIINIAGMQNYILTISLNLSPSSPCESKNIHRFKPVGYCRSGTVVHGILEQAVFTAISQKHETGVIHVTSYLPIVLYCHLLTDTI